MRQGQELQVGQLGHRLRHAAQLGVGDVQDLQLVVEFGGVRRRLGQQAAPGGRLLPKPEHPLEALQEAHESASLPGFVAHSS